MAPATSKRWCPTSEQLTILEEIYRSGVRTPNATQIQKITARLSLYGKIEGKNVFYWFQNHKARDRQKLRRMLNKQLQKQQQQQLFHHPQMQQNHYPIVHYLESLVYPAFSFYNPNTNFLSQLGVLDQDGQKQVINYTWNPDIPERVGILDKSMMRMYGNDWVMMVDVEPPLSPCCKSPSLKTLELFPITASNLREECKLQAPDQPNPFSV